MGVDGSGGPEHPDRAEDDVDEHRQVGAVDDDLNDRGRHEGRQEGEGGSSDQPVGDPVRT